ncbi:septal ring lytic transglycosylase RlpA family protein [Hydrotalea sp.]|uniref:septal ring lytic transglycosylase RlpA family protein n=1 Tax=Hydrotalea sp. TaxID=2881279 RepID=UPI00262A0072|nr:septal ring lytic transglycosylase RlpA family protein [Hydrotalea sp.]
MKIFLLNFFFFFCIAFIGKAQDSLAVVPVKLPKVVTGIASFYSLNLTGTQTATGERFDNKNMTAASNSFKLNTRVRVTNLRNDKSVIVRINDRMSKRMAKKGRVIDLSRAAARKLQFMKRGLVKVRVEEVDKDTLE